MMASTVGPLALRLHHVGVACVDIEQEARRLAPLGYVIEGERFDDAVQGVRGMFVTGQAPRLELLQPLGSMGTLTPWLKSGAKLYHLAYEANDIQQSIAGLRKDGAKLVVPPVPAVAFRGRLIAFVMLANLLLIELITKE
jgi:methylmalonyl-CoA/ethylmalonyl-CoA epimerase